MSHTNKTTHYNLPQFVADDTPGWLTDVNQAMTAIDGAIYQRQQAIASNADSITANTASIATLNSSIGTIQDDVRELESDLNSATTNISNNTTNIAEHTSQIQALANQLTNLNAESVAYDGATSGLEANTVQGAIDEINQKIITPSSWEDITDRFTTGSNVQEFKALMKDDMIIIEYQGSGSANTTHTVCTIPDNLKPETTRWTGSSIGGGNNPRATIISSDARSVQSVGSSTQWFQGTITYIVGE